MAETSVRPDILPPQHLTVSEAEQASGRLTDETVKLAQIILSCRGYVVLRGGVSVKFIDAVRAEFNDIYADCRAMQDTVETGTDYSSIQQVKVSERKHATFWFRKSRWRIFPWLTGIFGDRQLLANPFAMQILEGLIGKDLFCQYVSSDTCLKGAMLQSPHSDIDTNDVMVNNRWAPRGYIVNFPIMTCGLHNGPMEVWPGGSHMWTSDLMKQYGLEPNIQDGRNPPVERVAEYFPSIKIHIEPGDVMIRDLTMWHRGTPNPTDEPRTMLTIAYFRGGYQYGYGDVGYNLDRTVYQSLAPDVRRLFDYHFGVARTLRRKQKQLRSAVKKTALSFVNQRLRGKTG